MESNECCLKFNVEKWDKKTFKWNSKKFIKDSIPEIFHIPIPSTIDKKITRMWSAVEKNNAASPNKEDTLILFRDPTPFKGEIYISVDKDVLNEDNVTLSGTFISRVFDGGYNDVPKFIKSMQEYLSETNNIAKDYYIHYAYCPKCAKEYKHNYMIIFAKV